MPAPSSAGEFDGCRGGVIPEEGILHLGFCWWSRVDVYRHVELLGHGVDRVVEGGVVVSSVWEVIIDHSAKKT